ncbi:MAG TPA: CBS domain-containing protein [Flavobacteriaceae bacterium]|nr:CBS domain-containing protein [Flavobacteriaceae bacterium]
MGIKNYQGKFEKPEKTLSENIKVRDFMLTELITFKPEQHITEVVDILIKNKISGGPVVNESNELVGIISEGDCIRQLFQGQYHNLPPEKAIVENYMVREVETIDGNLTIFDAASRFLESRRRRFPIVENKKLIGMISQKDLLRASLRLNSQTWDRNQ